MSYAKLDLHKRALLKSWGLADDKSVIDCDPIAQTVTFSDGSVRQKTEIYTRVMGYHRPVSQWNPGKQQEHRERVVFREAPTNLLGDDGPADRGAA